MTTPAPKKPKYDRPPWWPLFTLTIGMIIPYLVLATELTDSRRADFVTFTLPTLLIIWPILSIGISIYSIGVIASWIRRYWGDKAKNAARAPRPETAISGSIGRGLVWMVILYAVTSIGLWIVIDLSGSWVAVFMLWAAMAMGVIMSLSTGDNHMPNYGLLAYLAWLTLGMAIGTIHYRLDQRRTKSNAATTSL